MNFSIYGTNAFNLVWEEVCANNFGSVLNVELKDLPGGLCSEYAAKRNKKLISIIDKPVWHKNNPKIKDEVSTLKPDLICIYPCNGNEEYCFGIYDAKYYCIDFEEQEKGFKVTGQPGVGDITKQYLYQLAYDDFIIKQGYKYVQNMFFCPQEKTEIDYGYVEMEMMHKIGNKSLENIAVVKLCAEEMYDLYLSNIHVENIADYIPSVAQKLVYSQNFTNRMIVYLRGISETSQAAEEKMKMKSEYGKLIYPEQIKREIGAKLIYDVICPFAIGDFYGFYPYEEKKYGSMVGEGIGNTNAICNELADVAIEIEKYIKHLSERDLMDEAVIRAILQQCLKSRREILVMTSEYRLGKLVEKIMRLIREIYL